MTEKTEEKFLQNLLTPEMRKKRARLACATDSDPMIRAQDVTEYSIQSVRCRHRPAVGTKCHTARTPKIQRPISRYASTDSLGKTRISYVTPDWGNRNYGDYWFDIPEEKVIDHQDGKTFVETFLQVVRPYLHKNGTGFGTRLETLARDLLYPRHAGKIRPVEKKWNWKPLCSTPS